jgi:hypothetical protein
MSPDQFDRSGIKSGTPRLKKSLIGKSPQGILSDRMTIDINR